MVGDLVWMGINLSSIYFSLFCYTHSNTPHTHTLSLSLSLTHTHTHSKWIQCDPNSRIWHCILNLAGVTFVTIYFKCVQFLPFKTWILTEDISRRFYSLKQQVTTTTTIPLLLEVGSDKSRLKKCCQIISSQHSLSHFKYLLCTRHIISSMRMWQGVFKWLAQLQDIWHFSLYIHGLQKVLFINHTEQNSSYKTCSMSSIDTQWLWCEMLWLFFSLILSLKRRQ